MNERPDAKRCTGPDCTINAHPAYGDQCESCFCSGGGVYAKPTKLISRRLPYAESEAFYKAREARRGNV